MAGAEGGRGIEGAGAVVERPEAKGTVSRGEERRGRSDDGGMVSEGGGRVNRQAVGKGRAGRSKLRSRREGRGEMMRASWPSEDWVSGEGSGRALGCGKDRKLSGAMVAEKIGKMRGSCVL